MKKLSCITTKIVGNLSSTLNLYIQLKSSWNYIIGKEMETFVRLDSIKYTGKNELTIFIKVLSSASLIIKHNSDNISKSISNLLGISNIKLIFQHTSILNVTSNSTELGTSEISDRKVLKNNEVINKTFENVSLKTALEHLKTEMKNAA